MHAVDSQFKSGLVVRLAKLDDCCEGIPFHFRIGERFLVELARKLGEDDCVVPVHLGDRKIVFLSLLELFQGLQQSLHELGADFLQADHISVGFLDHLEESGVAIVRIVFLEPNVVGEKCDM